MFDRGSSSLHTSSLNVAGNYCKLGREIDKSNNYSFIKVWVLGNLASCEYDLSQLFTCYPLILDIKNFQNAQLQAEFSLDECKIQEFFISVKNNVA